MENTELAVKGEDSLLALAIQKGLDTETLENLIALRNAEIERQAKSRFAEEFARMQAEFRPVGKSKTANDYNGKRLYSYCPIEDILAMAAPVMAKHGFSYRWTEEALANKEKRINCIVSGYGHSETSFVDIPFMDPVSKATNIVQMRGSATTYGKRYSFLNATGIIVGGEDDDAMGSNLPPNENLGGVAASEGPSPSPDTHNDPKAALRAFIQNEVQDFVNMVGADDDAGKPYFSDEEKAKYKKFVADINEGAKKANDLTIKLQDLKRLNDGIASELAERKKGHTPLANSIQAELAKKAEQKEIF